MVAVYLFYVDGWAKIGHTGDLQKRHYELMWGNRPGYVTASAGGDLVASRVFDTKAEAVSAERACQDALMLRLGIKRAVGGRPEWFQVSKTVAVRAFKAAVSEEHLPVEMTKSQAAFVLRFMRQNGLPSVEAALREIVARAWASACK